MFASATVDLGDVEKGITAMSRRAHALGPAFATIKKLMREDQKDHRRAKSGPDGSAWAPRAASTLASEHGKRKLARSLLGKIPSAVSYKSSATSAIGESKVKWSEVQRSGGVVGHGARIPARDFLWISDPLLDKSAVVVEDALLNSFGGG